MRNSGVTKTDGAAITASDVDGKTSASPLKIEGTANFFKAADTDGVSNLTRFKLTANYKDLSGEAQSQDLALNSTAYIEEDSAKFQGGNTYQIINKSDVYSKLYWGDDGSADENKLIFEIPIELPEQVGTYKIDAFDVSVEYSNEDYLEKMPITEQLDESAKSNGITYTLNGGNQTAAVNIADNASIQANIIIPDYVKDTNGVIYAVTSIGNNAFYECSSLGSVTIGNGVTSIGNNAFYECSSLGSVTIGNGVTSIDGGAFYGCTSLESVTIKSTQLSSVGTNAFAYWNEAENNGKTLPQSITFYIPSSVNKDVYQTKIAQGTKEKSWPANWSSTTIQE